jgi:2-amino-4-hydroxy-6-hydroxymethyldihydropteridine diphosphokinase
VSRAIISLGSNLGDRAAALEAAVRSFGNTLRSASAVYVTPPWGPVQQDEFYNQAIAVEDDDVDARGWLERCFAAERAAHRERDVRWGPRTLDADVVAVWSAGRPVVSDDEQLLLPHPRAAERAFVLVPWSEFEPDADLPGHGPIADLIAGLDTSRIRRLGAAGA